MMYVSSPLNLLLFETEKNEVRSMDGLTDYLSEAGCCASQLLCMYGPQM
jgi:hypothetical protein